MQTDLNQIARVGLDVDSMPESELDTDRTGNNTARSRKNDYGAIQIDDMDRVPEQPMQYSKPSLDSI
jgi:hypothetical protein